LGRLGRMLEDTVHDRIPRGFSQHVPDDEIGALARALDTAMERIGEFIQREQHFSRDASHELRTPIAVIDGAAALLEAEQLSVAGRSQLRRIRDACALMQRTTETLLALSREQGIGGAVEDLPVLPLVESAVVRAAYLLEGKEVEVRVEIGAEARFRASRAVLEILLANLIGNAFSHTDAGAVEIRMEAGALTVENTAALPPGLASTMFAPGVKSATSRGAGLGLSIAQRLAAVHGIDLSVTPGDTSVIARLRK
jgi:signal transduction histidine kinase